jgi:parallel beta-helix repeat protein
VRYNISRKVAVLLALSLALLATGCSVFHNSTNGSSNPAPASTFRVSGTISPALGDVSVTLRGAIKATVLTDSLGNYTFNGVPRGSYALTPSKSQFSFIPVSLSTNIGDDIAGIDFRVVRNDDGFSISGSISPSAAGSGATVTLIGPVTNTTTADPSGNFSFGDLPEGLYRVVPNKSGYSFNPPSRVTPVDSGAITEVNFVASKITGTQTYTISGMITPAPAGSGATINLSGSASATTVADSSGSFAFSGLPRGSYTLTPSKNQYSFNPSSRNTTVGSASAVGLNFVASKESGTPTYKISGTISPTEGGSGATVILSGAASGTTAADTFGNYSFTGLPSGTYQVTPSKVSFIFTPRRQTTTVGSSNVTGVNFTSSASINTVNIYPGNDIPNLVNAAPPGTTFVIYPGTYRLHEHIVPKNGDSFIGQTACAPPQSSCPTVLVGSRIVGNLAKFDGVNYEVTGQMQHGLVSQPTSVCEPAYLACNRPEDLFFDGAPYQHLYASSLPTVGPKQWWFDYPNHIIYFHDNPAGHTVETSVLDTAFESSANNVTIRYLTIKEFASPIQRAAVEATNGEPNQSSSLNWVIEECEIYNNHAMGVRPAFGTQVYNSYLHNNGMLGIGGGTDSSAPSGIIIQGNTVTHNNYAHVLPDYAAGGIKFGGTAEAVVRGNTVNYNEGTGIHFDVASSNPLIDGNTVVGNFGGGGIAYEISVNGATIRNNLLLKNGLAGPVATSTANTGSYASEGVQVYCNVVEIPNAFEANGILVSASQRGYNPAAPYQYLMTSRNAVHHNTVIWDAGAKGTFGYEQYDVEHQPDFFASNLPPDYNTYHLPNLSDARFQYDNNDSQQNRAKSFAEYQAAGADVHGSADTNYTSGFPIVEIASPADQSTFTNAVTIEASAYDKSGISRVEFYVDWKLQATITGRPYRFDWTAGATGTHIVAAMAYSNAGIRSCSAVTLKKN